MSVSDTLSDLTRTRLASRIWKRDGTAFTGPATPEAVQKAVRNRLGWLDAPVEMQAQVGAVETLAAELVREALTDTYLLGMGGSSLCAEVLRDVLAPADAASRLTVLDTTDERTIHDVTRALDPARSCFLVASKSGSTVEVTSLERHFRTVMEAARGPETGRHFVAITDPGTPLVEHAATHGYRRTITNPPDIGGRYSALSLFGLVPGAIAGANVTALLNSGTAMADLCGADAPDNPGLALGAFMGEAAQAGRDKLTLLLPQSLAPLGAWVEQLVAESTGKSGRGVLPVVDEPLGDPSAYGSDRAFVALVTEQPGPEQDLAAALQAAGHPLFEIETRASALGGEFFRWEFATAVAGAVLGVNPFDEPNVRSAKEHTQAQLDERRSAGEFKLDPPFESGPGYSRREFRPDAPLPRDGRYVALLDYLPAEPHRAAVVSRLRAGLRKRTGLAVTHGIGPRYLHSTGQYHKGGPDTGVFLLITAEDGTATQIPGVGYTFGVLKRAQAYGDFDALVAAGRPVIHYHIEDPNADFAAELEKVADRLIAPLT